MTIKEAILDNEKDLIKDFLLSCDLNYENTIEESLYAIDDKSNIIGTISREGNIIKCFAIDKNYRQDGLSSSLISEMINRLYQNNINHFLVYTKKEYLIVFESFGFKEIVSTDSVSILEYGIANINDVINNIRKNIENKFDINLDNEKINAIVLNGNPITNGHIYLIEEALKTANYLVVFVLEEDKSFFTFKERLTLAYISTLYLSNVIVIPSTEYIISNLTFPTYFLKEENKRNYEWMKTDALIFKNYFMKNLNIMYRYLGEETDNVMMLYNNVLKETLEDNCKIIPRLDNISGSYVRKLLKEGQIDKAIDYIPHQAKQMFKVIALGKNNE